MSSEERTETLIAAEGDLASAVRRIVSALGTERGEEVAAALVQEQIARLATRRKVIISLVREVQP